MAREVLLLVADGAARWWRAVPNDVVIVADEVEKGEVVPSAHTRQDGAPPTTVVPCCPARSNSLM
jgi:hypothetical protein